MICTSAEAAKLLKELTEEMNDLLRMESMSCSYVAAVGEDLEAVRPVYDFAGTQARLDLLEAKTRRIKHAINQFNASHLVPGFDMTIDQILVYIPQLSRRKDKLSGMKNTLPKARVNNRGTGTIIEYKYANYDLDTVTAEYDRVADELRRAQLGLDAVNSTETFELDID
ncbi:MAG: hypothetical protein MJ192_00120 [Clostridia bacterium]|nr:hypothetical protein [Clostridia bacterium]